MAPHPVLGTSFPHSHASALAATPGVHVVAACDIRPQACEEFTKQWRERWPGLNTYEHFEELLTHESIDLLCVVTPDHMHETVVRAAVEAGVRAIFCEKPFTTELPAADRLVRLCRDHKVALAVNFGRRWYPTYVAAREMVGRGRIGPLSQIIVRLGGPRAMLFRNHSHSIDLICYFAESEPEWVFAELEPALHDYGTAYRGDGGHDPTREPGVNAYIAFENGIRAYLSGMKNTFEEVHATLIGTEGRIDVDDHTCYLTTKGDTGTVVEQIHGAYSDAGMQAGVKDLLAVAARGGQTLSPPEEARKSVAITAAILESCGRSPRQVSKPTPA